MTPPVTRLAADVAARVARTPAAEVVLTRLESAMRRDRSLAVLTYHRVDHPERRPWLYPGLISATPDAFERQVAWLSARFAVLSMDEVLATRRRLPRRALLVTFDDGYADFAEYAWPILRAAGLPATLFVATAAVADESAPFWWDRLYDAVRHSRADEVRTPAGVLDLRAAREHHAAFRSILARLKQVPHATVLATVDRVEQHVTGEEAFGEPGADGQRRSSLDWAELRQLEREGLSIAPHTRTHALLPRIPVSEARAEIEGSRADLAATLDHPRLGVFAYPSGAYDDATVALMRELGTVLAFTTDPGLNGPRSDPLRLRRFNVGWRSGPAVLAARLLGSRLRAGAGAPWHQDRV